MNKTFKKYQDIIVTTHGRIEERELISMRSAMKTNKELAQWVLGWFASGKVLDISEEHQRKGIVYLRNLLRTPAGKIRKNAPFRHEQAYILDNYSHLVLANIIDIGRGFPFYVPVFRCFSTEGDYFDYYWNGNGITFTNNYTASATSKSFA